MLSSWLSTLAALNCDHIWRFNATAGTASTSAIADTGIGTKVGMNCVQISPVTSISVPLGSARWGTLAAADPDGRSVWLNGNLTFATPTAITATDNFGIIVEFMPTVSSQSSATIFSSASGITGCSIVQAGTKLEIDINGVKVLFTSTTDIAAMQPHLAILRRVSGAWALDIDGVKQSITDSTAPNAASLGASVGGVNIGGVYSKPWTGVMGGVAMRTTSGFSDTECQATYAAWSARNAAQAIFDNVEKLTKQGNVGAFFHFEMPTFAPWTGVDAVNWNQAGPSAITSAALSNLSVGDWLDSVQKAGCTGIIFTAKHWSGFCWWPTATTARSVASTPWAVDNASNPRFLYDPINRVMGSGTVDVVGKVITEARARGMWVGLYFNVYDASWNGNGASLGQDPEITNSAYTYSGTPVPRTATAQQLAYFRDQIQELLTRYGKIDVIFTDSLNDTSNGANPINPANDGGASYDYLYGWIHAIQPDCLVVSNIVGGYQYAGNVRTDLISNENITQWNTYYGHTQIANGLSIPFSQYTQPTMNLSNMPDDPGIWFDHPQFLTTPLTAEYLAHFRELVAGQSRHLYIINTPPKADGTLDTRYIAPIQASTIGKNLALGKTVTANSYYLGNAALYGPKFATDGVVFDKTQVLATGSTGSTSPYCEVDLGSMQTIQDVLIAHPMDSVTDYRLNGMVFELYDSSHTLITTSFAQNGGSVLNLNASTQFIAYRFSPTPCRYVRAVWGQVASGGTYVSAGTDLNGSSLSEFMVFSPAPSASAVRPVFIF